MQQLTVAPPLIPAPADHRPWQARLPFFYGWVIVAVAVLMGLMSAALNWVALGVFALPMQEELGWSRTALFSALTVRSYLSAALSPFIGRYFDSPHGARIISLGSGMLMAANMAMLTTVQTEAQFMLQFGIIGGLVSAGQVGQVTAIVPKWFIRRRGISMAIATLGSGSAAFILPVLIAYCIGTFGWREAWVVMGALVFLLAGVPALLIRRQPEDVGLLPDGGVLPPAGQPRPADEWSYTAKQAFRSRAAWLLLVGVSFGGLANGGLPGSLAPMLADQGLGRDAAVVGLTLYGLGSVAGRFVWSFPAAYMHVRWLLLAIAVQGMVGTPLLPFLPHEWALAYPVIVGIGIGGYVGYSQTVWATYFGRRHLGSITGISRPAFSLVAGTAPIILSLSFDLTTSYQPALWAISGCYALAALAYVALGAPRPPTEANS